MSPDQHPAWANVVETLISPTCNPNEDSEGKADQEQHEDQDKMSFRQGVEPHGGQPVTGRHSLDINRHKLIIRATRIKRRTNRQE